jgi:ATP-dependent helicase/nuclease subunit A
MNSFATVCWPMTERQPVDQEVRDLALEPGRSFIVQAPAGSGKTELLTQRFLRLLATVQRPEEIVAITFTRKAAGEMRSRILEALHSGAEARPPTEPHRVRGWMLARAALARDRELGWGLLESPRRLRIETIDALNAWLARQLPLSAGLGAAPVIASDPDPIYRNTAREVLLSAGGDDDHGGHAAALLAHLGGRFGQAEELIVSLLRSRDHWLGKVVQVNGASPSLLRARLDEALQHFIEDELHRARDSLPAELHPEIATLGAGAATRAADNAGIASLSGLAQLPEPHANRLEAWRALAELLQVKSGEWRRRLDKNVGFPAGASPEKQRMKALLEELSERADPEPLARVRTLPEPGYGEARWAILEHLLALLPVCAAQLMVAFASRGESDYVGIARAALGALGTAEEPTDLALALDCRISHLLVDEFQDTSQAQVELLAGLMAGWTPGDGRTVFCVGDPMQSIYRFREADVGRFLKAQLSGLGPVPLEGLQLSVNFRSQAALVDWVSGTFPQIFPAKADMALGAVPFAPSAAWHEALPGAPVEFTAVPPGDALAEAEAVAAIVARVRRDEPEASVGILVRGRRHLDRITPALRAAGIAFQAVDIEPLGESPAVRDLEALTRAICHRADRTAWLAVLRAPWCGLRLDDLTVIAGDRHADPWERLEDPGVRAALSPEGQARTERLVEALRPALADRGRRPLRRIVEGAWLALGGPATLEHASGLGDARRFLEFLHGHERHGDLDAPATLAELFCDLYAAPDPGAGDRVQLLTIHKAKGLEFDHVILPGLDRTVGQDAKHLLRWLEVVREAGTELILAPVEPLGEEKDELHRALRDLEKRRELLEQDRILYVAMTRARRRLYLVAGVSDDDPESGDAARPKSGSALARLWETLGPSFLAARSAVAVPDRVAPARPAPMLRRFPLDWQSPDLPVAPSWAVAEDVAQSAREAVEYDWAGRDSRALGVVVHRLLQVISREGAGSWNEVRLDQARPLVAAMLTEAGLDGRDRDTAVARCMEALAQTLADPRGRWLLDPGHLQAVSERRVSGRLDGRLVESVIDRSFVDETGVLWIIDYKTGRHEGGGLDGFLDREQERYRPQLERYARLLGPQHDGFVRLGLYFPQHAGWREWAPSA